MRNQLIQRINQESCELLINYPDGYYPIPEVKQLSIGSYLTITGIYLKSDYVNVYMENSETNAEMNMNVFSQAVLAKLVDILVDGQNTRVYKHSELSAILKEMTSYLDGCSDEELSDHFKDIVGTSLFHDACGKIIEDNANSVIVSTDY